MMPRERITFQRFTSYKSNSGQNIKDWVPASEFLTDVPAERRKQKSSNEATLNAKEEFIELTIVFWLRYDESITDDLRIIYNGKSYKILDINRNFHDNSCLITCTKTNDR